MGNQNSKKIKRKNNKKDNNFVTFFLPFIVILLVAIVLVITELTIVSKNREKMSEAVEENSNENNTNVTQEVTEEEKKGMNFETFVDKTYSQEELENMTSEGLYELRQNQINFNNETTNLLTEQVIGSSPTSDGAKVLASSMYSGKNQFVRKLNIALETDVYYLVDIEWDYITQETTKKYNNQVLVYKDFYYDVDKKILNLDDMNKVKQCLDVENYMLYYSNTSKRLIQSFIVKEGERCEYVLYYFDIKYEEDTGYNTMSLCKKTVKINAASGKIEDEVLEQVSDSIQI